MTSPCVRAGWAGTERMRLEKKSSQDTLEELREDSVRLNGEFSRGRHDDAPSSVPLLQSHLSSRMDRLSHLPVHLH